ncbi:MAG: hypothetical protein HON90_00215 [Halobacteriovoraceae bacterium]|jgi:hypothetical protein|nr:hypothetical protein [Halobacteriovoraceae bacterium]
MDIKKLPALKVLKKGEISDVEFLYEYGFGQANIFHKWGHAQFFTWGYNGNGPTDFAMNILDHFTKGDREFVRNWSLDFVMEVTSKITKNEGIIKAEFILDWIESKKGKTSNQALSESYMQTNGCAQTYMPKLLNNHYTKREIQLAI